MQVCRSQNSEFHWNRNPHITNIIRLGSTFGVGLIVLSNMFRSIKNVGIKFTQVPNTIQRSSAIPHFSMQFGKYFSPICANCRNTTIPATKRQKIPGLLIQIVTFHLITWNECIFWVSENPLSVTISAERKRWHSWRLVSTILNVFTLPLPPTPILPRE